MIDFIALVVAAGCASLIAIIILAIDHISRKVTKMSAVLDALSLLQAQVAATVARLHDEATKPAPAPEVTAEQLTAMASDLKAATDALPPTQPPTP